MRHGKKFNHLSRKAGHRKALLKNMAIALIEHKRINTTLAKAKALRQYIEPLVTKAKTNTTHSRRVVFSYLQHKAAVAELFGPIAEQVGDRPGGYVRVIRLGFRKSDSAELAMIEFVDFNEVYDTSTEVGGSKRRRRRRRGGGGGSTTETATAAPATEATEAAETKDTGTEEATDETEAATEEATDTESTDTEATEEEAEDTEDEEKK